MISLDQAADGWIFGYYGYMKPYFLLVTLLLSACLVKAQVPTKATTIAKQAEVLSYSSDLSQGKLVFTKVFRKGNAEMYLTTYTMWNAAYNNGKAIDIKLTKEAFDSYFRTTPELSARYNQLIKYAQDQKLSFADEKAWASLMDFFNELSQ